MKKLFTLFIFCLFTFISQAQTFVGDITLTTQEEVDNFSTNYPGITYVEGTLTVGELFDFEIISDLSGLIQLTGARDLLLQEGFSFSGWIPTNVENLTIDSYGINVIDSGGTLELETFTSELTNLNNLYLRFEAIENAEFGVTLFENLVSVDSLTIDLVASPVTFPSLETINHFTYWPSSIDGTNGGYIQMPEVTSLNTLMIQSGGLATNNSTPNFPNLNHIEYCAVNNLDVLDGFVGLASLTSIGTFETQNSYLFTSLEGLANIQTANVLSLWGYYGEPNESIGLESLQSVRRLRMGTFFDVNLLTLTNLQVVDTLEIFSSEGLNSLAGIENLTINNYLRLSGTNLSICNVPSVCNFISTHTPEDYFIDINNPTGCSSAEEIIASCSPDDAFVFGNVYFDSNCNGSFDSNEFSISPTYIQPVAGADLFLGLESFLLTAPPQTDLTIEVGGLPSYYAAGAPVNLTTPPFGGNVINQNIAVCPTFDFNDLQISILQFGNLSPGFISLWKLKVDNLGTSTIDFIPSLTFNTPEFIASVNALGGTFMNDMISWTATSISPGQTLEFDFNITLLPTATILGETFSASASVALVSGTDENPSDNTAHFEQEITGSYDPNDKWVNTPQINIETIDPSQPLELTYRVRFQNTGTAPAVNVRVEDVLEEDLDPSTFQLISSTHEVYYQIEGNQINFFFNDIMLPDSTSDPEGSIGTFFFRIKSNGNHTLQSSIDNQVSIFFDFNEPIITNVASTIFYNCPVVDIAGESVSLCAGEELELSAVATNNTSIQWFVNEEQVSSSDSYSFTSDLPNDYSVLVIAENEYCEDGDEIEITVNENTEVTLVLDGSTLVATEGFASYQWTLNGNIIEGENGNTLSSPAIGNYVVSVTNEFGCSDQSDEVEVVIGINELNIDQIALWPNPANDVLNIQTAYRGIINIIDMQGKQVMNFTLNGQASLDISPLPTGLYQITSSSGLLGQFIKQ